MFRAKLGFVALDAQASSRRHDGLIALDLDRRLQEGPAQKLGSIECGGVFEIESAIQQQCRRQRQVGIGKAARKKEQAVLLHVFEDASRFAQTAADDDQRRVQQTDRDAKAMRKVFDDAVEHAHRAAGDLHIDAHHTVEDIGITFGQAFNKAIGDKSGIRRYGHAYVPLDEALISVVVDLSGRPFLAYDVKTRQTRIGGFEVELIHDFLLAFVNENGMNLHVRMLAGRNPHHVIEATFKGMARALDLATQRDPRVQGVLSTKGTL